MLSDQESLLDCDICLSDVRLRFMDGLICFDDVVKIHEKWVSINQYTVMAFPVDNGIPVKYGKFTGGVKHFKYEY